jgi:hypothetical protein
VLPISVAQNGIAGGLGVLGATLVPASLVALAGYGLGARTRSRLGGRAPTSTDLFHDPRRVGWREYGTAQWSPRVLSIAPACLVLGIILLGIGVAS